MPAPKNVLKQKLVAGDVLYGCWVGLADSYLAEITATAGFDWLLIDGEHAPNDLRSIMSQLQLIEASNSYPIVRLPDDDSVKIKQALDIGVQSLLIPMVTSADQAATIVQATRYPPQGFRGVGAALARASNFNATSEYITTANDQICVIVQVESREGMNALDDILKVDGVDGVFIGPSDLAADMGHPGNPNADEVITAVMNALSTIKAANKISGVLSTENHYIESSIKAGANFIGVGIDVMTYASAIRELAKKWCVKS